MNEGLQLFARNEIKKGLAQLTKDTHKLFKRMYSPNDLDKDIYKVVDDMPADKLNRALNQVERTIRLEQTYRTIEQLNSD